MNSRRLFFASWSKIIQRAGRYMKRLSSVAIVVLAILSASDLTARQRLPEGFRELTDEFWDSPWVFDQSGRALPRVESSWGQLRDGPLSIRLDDGRQGVLQVQLKDYDPTKTCPPSCGCIAVRECFWVEIADRRGKVLARMPFYATYGRFDIVPVDLVGGPGDELIIVTIPAKASPPLGYNVNIWKVGAAEPVELLDPFRLAAPFGTQPISCAKWRTSLVLDATTAKPRDIRLRTEFAATIPQSAGGACLLYDEETERVAALKRRQTLRFERGKYQ